MPAHPERLAAFAVAAAFALSLLLGVVWRDQIACGLVEASGLTMIGPKIFADAPVDARESALLLDLARESRQRAAANAPSSDEPALIFSDSNFWRGDADARVIRTPFRTCVVIGPQARGLDRIASELARVGQARGDAPKAPSLAPAPAAGARQSAATPMPGAIERPASPPATEPLTKPLAQANSPPPPGATPNGKAPESSVAAVPDATPKPTQSEIAAPQESKPPAPPASEARASPPPQTAPAHPPESSTSAAPANPAPANAGASAPEMAETPPVQPHAPSGHAQEAAPSAPRAAPAPQASAPSAGPRPLRSTPRTPAQSEAAPRFSPPQAAPPPRSRIRPGQPIQASLPARSTPPVARHIRPTQSRAARPPAAPWLAPTPPPIAPPRTAQTSAPTPHLPAHPNPFAVPSLWDAWARRDPLASAPSLRRMDRVGGVLYQARDLRNETLCSTGSTNGYCRCRRASMRRWR